MIWKRKIPLEALNAMGEGNMVGLLDIRFEHIGDDTLEATMPVDSRTKQPFGLLHGGASVVLAESIGSVAGYLCTEGEQKVVGLEINANHVRFGTRRAGARRMQTVASRFASPGLAD
ncbi:esterase [Escherichia coli]|nr:esterase [Escherichia coli]